MSSDDGSRLKWLGLLKWSLAQTDGTRSSDLSPMSEEDKKFLESVMTDGIVDEGKRMEEILRSLVLYVENRKNGEDEDLDETASILEGLQELCDIVEQIDFARAFSSMGNGAGIEFMLNCASTRRDTVPRSVRVACLATLATAAQNNPPVQDRILRRHRGLEVLGKLYYDEENAHDDTDGKLRSRVVQAISCTVRNHAEGEESFCQSDDMRAILELGLGLPVAAPSLTDVPTTTEGVIVTDPPPAALKRRCLFLLRALVTSDTSSVARINSLQASLQVVVNQIIYNNDGLNHTDDDVETALGLLVQLAKQGKAAVFLQVNRDQLAASGVSRITELRRFSSTSSPHELTLWEDLLVELSRYGLDQGTRGEVESYEEHGGQHQMTLAPMMLGDRPSNDPCHDFAQ